MEERLALHILASGSKGNAAIVEGPAGSVLVDCGLARRTLIARAAELGVDAEAVSLVLITHEHTDHVKGLAVWSRHWEGPILASPGTAGSRRLAELDVSSVAVGATFEAVGMGIRTLATSHDTREPMGLVFATADDSIALITDTGVFPEEALEAARGCRIIALESNHDEAMLAEGPYPWALKRRVGGELGHLSNRQAAEAARRIVTPATETVVAMHLSQENNRPSLAVRSLAEALGAVSANTTFTRARRTRPGSAGAGTLEIIAASQERPLTIR